MQSSKSRAHKLIEEFSSIAQRQLQQSMEPVTSRCHLCAKVQSVTPKQDCLMRLFITFFKKRMKMPITNTHNMGGVRNTTSTDSPEKTSTGKSSYGKSVKLFGSQLKKNARDAVKGFDAEKLRSRFEKFCATTGPQAKQCASDLCTEAERHLQKGCKEARKQCKKAKPHLEKAMHSIQKNYGALKNKVEGKIEKKLDEWAQKRGYKREPENHQSYQSEEKWAGLRNPEADARNEVPEFHRGGTAKVNISTSQHTAESESPHWDFRKIPTALRKEANDLYATFNRDIGPDDDYDQMMDEKNEAREALNTLFQERDVLDQTEKRLNATIKQYK